MMVWAQHKASPAGSSSSPRQRLWSTPMETGAAAAWRPVAVELAEEIGERAGALTLLGEKRDSRSTTEVALSDMRPWGLGKVGDRNPENESGCRRRTRQGSVRSFTHSDRDRFPAV
ncbi:hypothetical protein U9M48_020661 [Paspalum notatum var. saurae]|uniref:Uncharacterized protein n=1 Tax=Paspalum notatum var. saurae TaxID=547442 RepID=A0AAQ3TIN4_PASNO